MLRLVGNTSCERRVKVLRQRCEETSTRGCDPSPADPGWMRHLLLTQKRFFSISAHLAAPTFPQLVFTFALLRQHLKPFFSFPLSSQATSAHVSPDIVKIAYSLFLTPHRVSD